MVGMVDNVMPLRHDLFVLHGGPVLQVVVETRSQRAHSWMSPMPEILACTVLLSGANRVGLSGHLKVWRKLQVHPASQISLNHRASKQYKPSPARLHSAFPLVAVTRSYDRHLHWCYNSFSRPTGLSLSIMSTSQGVNVSARLSLEAVEHCIAPALVPLALLTSL